MPTLVSLQNGQKSLRLGSRDSPLALVQTNMVAQRLHRAFPDVTITVETFKTQGDRILEVSLSRVGGKGLFVKELEEALLDGRIDLAIHSLKDMPAEMPAGLALCSVLAREDARDVLLSRDGKRLSTLKPCAVLGTSSLRRETQLRRLRPDLRYELIRGNLQTRYRKLFEPPYDAIVLAAAGVNRLNWSSRVAQAFDPWHESIPAPGQGILAAQYREDDDRVQLLLQNLRQPAVEIAQRAERAVLQGLNASCTTPLGAYCRVAAHGYELKGILLMPPTENNIETTLDDSLEAKKEVIEIEESSQESLRPIIVELRFAAHESPEEAGHSVAKALLAQGGQAILDQLLSSAR
jgi:hydroxymethylbilane synthase